MNIADLFVNLSVKGADKAKKDVGGVDKGMKGLASSSLAAKATILAALYAVERLVSGAAKMGTNLRNFGKATGLNIQEVQKWQWAAKQAGSTAEDMAASLKAVQNAIVNTRMGNAPAGLAAITQSIGIDDSQFDDVFYTIGKLREYARKNLNDPYAASWLSSIGLSDTTIGALRDDRFDPSKATGIMSNAQVDNLEKLDRKIDQIYSKIQKSVARLLTSKEGTLFLNTIENTIVSVLKLSESLIKLADNMKVFAVVGSLLEGINKAVTGITASATGPGTKTGTDVIARVKGSNNWQEAVTSILMGPGQTDFLKNPTLDAWMGRGSDAGRTPQSVTVNQEFNFSGAGGLNANDVGRAARDQVNEAFRQMQSQTQGN